MTLNVFIPLQKADLAKREVWGVAAVEQADQAREIMDYEKSKPHFLAWSERIKKASGGKSLGNVRDSHTTQAVGKVIAIEADDVTKAIRVGVKVVDDNAWRKVLEGVFTGFSIGGSYGKRSPDAVLKDHTRYEAIPNELSLVDVPCMPDAQFEFIKTNGESEMKKVMSEEEKKKFAEEMQAKKDGETNSETTPAEGDTANAEGESQNAESQGDEPKDEGSEQPAEAEESAEGETREEPAQGMNAESVKQVVIQLLLELGLVQESGGAFKAVQSNDLEKSVKGQMSKVADLQKSFDGLKTSIVSDIAKIVNAVGVLEKRGAGPVLREVAPLTAQKQADTQRADLLKRMADDTADPIVKQSLQNEAAKLQIKQIQNS